MKVTQAAKEFLDALGYNGERQQDWRDFAVCASLPTEATDAMFYGDNPQMQMKAMLICMECPVMRECREFARDNGISHGVWGGESRTDRGLARDLTADTAEYVKMTDGVPSNNPNPEWEYILYPERRPGAQARAA